METNPGVNKVAVETKFNRLGEERRSLRFAVDTKFKRLGVDTIPINAALLRYPNVPRPITVDTNFSCVTSPEINPKDVDNEEIAAAIELFMDNVDTYPAVPNPATVEPITDISAPPGPNAVEKLEIA